MENDRNLGVVLDYQACYATEPVVNADDVKLILFFLNQTINEFGGTQNVVDEDVIEEFDVSSPFLEVVHDEEREDIACVSYKGAVNFNAFDYFASLQVSRVKRENRNIVPNVNVFLSDVFSISAQAPYQGGRIFPNEKANSQKITCSLDENISGNILKSSLSCFYRDHSCGCRAYWICLGRL